MGNRAHVFFSKEVNSPGIYLHWNGGPESVLAFVRTMEARGWTRMDYGPARLAAVAVEFFDAEGDCEGYSVGMDPYTGNTRDYDMNDNGCYFVRRDQGRFWLDHFHSAGTAITYDCADPKLWARALETMTAIEGALAECREKRRPAKKKILAM